jgi:hypothetical protein
MIKEEHLRSILVVTQTDVLWFLWESAVGKTQLTADVFENLFQTHIGQLSAVMRTDVNQRLSELT